jgi:hypothetical protein
VFICPHLRLKKDKFLTADDNGLTLIHADEDKRDRNNSDSKRFNIKVINFHISELSNFTPTSLTNR